MMQYSQANSPRSVVLKLPSAIIILRELIKVVLWAVSHFHWMWTSAEIILHLVSLCFFSHFSKLTTPKIILKPSQSIPMCSPPAVGHDGIPDWWKNSPWIGQQQSNIVLNEMWNRWMLSCLTNRPTSISTRSLVVLAQVCVAGWEPICPLHETDVKGEAQGQAQQNCIWGGGGGPASLPAPPGSGFCQRCGTRSAVRF